MKFILISTDRVLHSQWENALDNKSIIKNIYSKSQLSEYRFNVSDIVLFDLDELEDSLYATLKANVICLSAKLDNIKAYKLLKEGVKAFGIKTMSPLNLSEVIKTVKKNKVWVQPELMSFIIQNSTLNNMSHEREKFEQLSNRELDVVRLVSKGLSNKEIASNLSITERTVKAHISSTFSKT